MATKPKKPIGRLTQLENRFLDWGRSPRAHDVIDARATGTIGDFGRRKYCVLVSYRRDGRGVPSPLWFGVADGRLYVHTAGFKVRRIERNPAVRVAPSTFRGKPVGPPFEGTARLLEPAESDVAERAIQSNYGLIRTLYYRVTRQSEKGVYVEVTPNA